MKIGILEVGQCPHDLISTFGTYADFFHVYLDIGNQEVEYSDYAVFEGVLPRSTVECDAYIVTGSSYSVYDELSWINALKKFLVQAAETQKIIGCCFGHQIIAEAFGGKVKRSKSGWGVGYHIYDIHKKKTWMEPQKKSLSLLAAHQDQVVLPPPSASVLAGSEFCPVGMMAINDQVLTTQLHPEFTREFAGQLYHKRIAKISRSVVDNAIARLAGGGDEQVFRKWAQNFLRS